MPDLIERNIYRETSNFAKNTRIIKLTLQNIRQQLVTLSDRLCTDSTSSFVEFDGTT